MADVGENDTMKNYQLASAKINPETSRYPHCIVWTPIPVLSWVSEPAHMGTYDSFIS